MSIRSFVKKVQGTYIHATLYICVCVQMRKVYNNTNKEDDVI